MAFRSVDEFIRMYRQDPRKARDYLDQALSEGRDPIASTNPGYGKYSDAIKRRMKRNKKKPNTVYNNYEQ